MGHGGECAGTDEGEQTAGGSQGAALPQEAKDTEEDERRNGNQEFANFEGDKARNQDSRGNGSQGREQRISQWK